MLIKQKRRKPGDKNKVNFLSKWMVYIYFSHITMKVTLQRYHISMKLTLQIYTILQLSQHYRYIPYYNEANITETSYYNDTKFTEILYYNDANSTDIIHSNLSGKLLLQYLQNITKSNISTQLLICLYIIFLLQFPQICHQVLNKIVIPKIICQLNNICLNVTYHGSDNRLTN